MLILIGGGALFCCMLTWSLLRQGGSETDAPGNGTAMPSNVAQDDGAVIPLTTEVAISNARSLVNARSADDLRGLIRPGKISAVQAVQVLHDLSIDQGPPQSPRWMGSVDSLMRPLEAVLVPYAEGRGRLVLFTPDNSGNWMIDFDAFAQLSEPRLEALVSGKASSGTLRVLANRDTYYNGIYTDESRFACFALRSAQSDAVIYGYCAYDSDAMAALLAVEAKAAAGETATKDPRQIRSRIMVEVERKPESADKQFEITRVLSDTWVKSDVALDEMIRARGGQ
ncbi:hypothetical protein [Haloferula rosea]|uniref:Uncharacterized protein n=1 Tax=Haloferula rosea TaxID=490093 RepID=A0A934RE22_9BACT|nr:hypothetical protein [Haloferula rosea]MBK1827396.1 hypothetical protein [Haloferula rosea]